MASTRCFRGQSSRIHRRITSQQEKGFFSFCQLVAHLCLINWAFFISCTFCYLIILTLLFSSWILEILMVETYSLSSTTFFRSSFQLIIEMITGFYILWCKGNFQHSIVIPDQLVEIQLIHYLLQWPSSFSARTCCFTLVQREFVFVLIRV